MSVPGQPLSRHARSCQIPHERVAGQGPAETDGIRNPSGGPLGSGGRELDNQERGRPTLRLPSMELGVAATGSFGVTLCAPTVGPSLPVLQVQVLPTSACAPPTSP